MFVVIAGSASAAAPVVDAGGNQNIDEDASTAFTGSYTDADVGDPWVEGWIFDGNDVAGNPASWTFSTPGSFSASYWVDDGTSNVSDTITITVADITPPSADAGPNQNVDEDTVVSLDASSTTDNDPNFGTTGRYYWTFSDNGVSRSLSGQIQTYTFNTPGTYSINLLVLDAAGNFASSIMTVTANDITAPAGSGTVPASANEGTSVAFSSSAITDNDPSFSTNRRDYWTFTDGAARNLSGTSPSYTFNTPGVFSITLTVMDMTGNTHTQVFSITIVDITAPTGSGTVPSTANEGASVAFSSSAITDNDPTFSSNRRDYWTFTDGVARNLSGSSQSYTFNTPGSYGITLTVMDITGNMLTASFTISIKDITLPSGAGTVPATAVEDTLVSFSSSAITDNDPTFSSNRRDYWTFTDGSARNLSGTDPTYTFNTPGTFVITLTVMDLTGNKLTQGFTLVIGDVTAPVPVIAAASQGQSREQYSVVSFSGTTSDNVAVIASWWLFNNGTAQNLSGTSVTNIRFFSTGVYTITFESRDAAFNIGTATTSITIFADTTAPTITFILAPTTGDNSQTLNYTATATDNNPTCATTCGWNWSMDGTIVSTAVGAFSTVWTPGVHTLLLTVRDANGNIASSSRTVTIDELVSVDTTLNGVNQTLNNNIRIINGATYTILNSVIRNSTTGVTVTITVQNGRLIVQDSTITSLSTTSGFRIVGTAAPGSSVVMFFNRSTVGGLFAAITITNGTLSATDSTFRELRLASASMFLATDSNVYLTNVTLLSNTLTTTGGVRLVYTSLISLLQRRDVIIEGLNATQVARSPFLLTATSVVGTVDVTVRDSILRSTSPVSGVRGIDLTMSSSSGVFIYRFQRIDAQNVQYGGLNAVHSSFTGTARYTITDCIFDAAVSGNGMFFQFTASSSMFDISMTNVSSQRNGQTGVTYRFENTGTNTGSILMTQLTTANNTLDGVYTLVSNSRTTLNWTMDSSVVLGNRRHGMWFDTSSSSRSALAMRVTDTSVIGSSQRGIWYNSNNQRVNTSFDFVRTTIDSNIDWGMYAYIYEYAVSDTNTVGSLWLNFTQSTITRNRGGLWVMSYYGNTNVTGVWTDTNFNNNQQEGVFFDSQLQYLYYNGLYMAPMFNATIFADRVSLSNNGLHGIRMRDYQYGLLNCCWQSVAPSALFDLTLNNSHVDRNAMRGVFHDQTSSYSYYASSLVRVTLSEGTTVDYNGGAGYYDYRYDYIYSMFGAAARPTELLLLVINASLSYNGQSQGDGYGIYVNNEYAYGAGPLTVELHNATVVRNAASGLSYILNWGYEATSFTVNIYDSNFSANGGKGVETYYNYPYYSTGGVYEHIENTIFIANGGEAISHSYPGSYNRYNVMWTVEYINNTIDLVPTHAIVSTNVYSDPYYAYAGAERFNFSGNRITHVAGAAILWSFEPPADGQSIYVDFSRNYIADTDEGVAIAVEGSSNTQHTWYVLDNVIERTGGNALLLSMNNRGSGNSGELYFERNVFRNTGGAAFTLLQSNMIMGVLQIKDCVFDTQRTGIELSGIRGVIDNVTFIGSVKEDVIISDGVVDIHNTAVDATKLKPIGNAAAFNVFFWLKVYLVWSGTGKPVIGGVAEFADAMGNTFFVGTIADASGLPSLELWSYSKSTQGVLGRTPFRVRVSYFELSHQENIDLFSDRVVTIQLIDDIQPTIVIATPLPNYGTQGDTIDVEGTAYDSQSGFVFDINDPQLPAQYVELSVDNINWVQAHIISSSAFDVRFDYQFTGLPEDVDALYVRVHDDSLNYVTKIIPIRVDRTAPIVTILSPVGSNLVTNGATVHISAETEVGALVLVNGLAPPEVFTRPDGVHIYFEMDIPVFEGPQTITVVAIDALNNQGNASLFVLVDRQPPYLAVLDPEVDALVNASDVAVSGLTETSGVTVRINGQLVDVDPVTGAFSGSVHLLTDINRVEIMATDVAGNVQLVVREVRLDTTAPWINIQSPAVNALLNSQEVDVVGIVEPGSTLIVNDEVVNAPTGAFQRRILLTEGLNTIVFVAIDPAGNLYERDVFVTVDTQRPQVDITSPTNETLWNRTSVLVTGMVSDEHSPSLSVNGQDIAVNTDGTFQVAVPLYEGTNFLTLEAKDGAGNTNTKVLTVIRDTQAPFLVSSLEGAFFEGVALKTHNTTVTVVGSTERGALLEVCYANAASAQVCNPIPLAADGAFRTFVDLRLEQTNTVTVTSTDAAGNTVSRSFQVVQEPREAIAPQGIDYTIVGLYGLGAAILLGSFFLLYMRRGKDDRAVELSSDTPGYYGDQQALQPSMDAGAVAGAPEYGVPMDSSVGEVAPAAEGAPMAAPEASMAPAVDDVPAAPSRPRPMRRRPTAGTEGAGEEGGGLTGMGAEDEALPGDTHQSGEDENKGA